MRYSTRSHFRFIPLSCCFIALALGVRLRIPIAAAQSPATQPIATQPADEPVAHAPMRRWFDRLADADPKVRDQAKIDLMGLPGSELPKLRQLIIEHQPILPAQACALHDIVVQSLLAEETYEAMNGEQTTVAGDQAPYFLGVEWTTAIVDPDDLRLGVTIENRLPGFPSYRYLRTGDMILGILVDPNIPVQQEPNIQTHTYQELVDGIKSRPDQTVTLLILRDGERIRLSIRMAPRPYKTQFLNTEVMADFKSERADRADAYWQENFVPLLESRNEGEIAE